MDRIEEAEAYEDDDDQADASSADADSSEQDKPNSLMSNNEENPEDERGP